MNKQSLIEKLNLTYSFIEQLLARISERDMVDSIVYGERSPKDIVAHIAAWNWNGIEWIKSIAKGEKPLLPMEGHSLNERDAVFAELNSVIHRENLDKTLKDVLDNHYESWRVLMNTVETLTQENLDKSVHLEWTSNQIQGWTVVAWRIGHADHHAKQIEAWLDSKQ